MNKHHLLVRLALIILALALYMGQPYMHASAAGNTLKSHDSAAILKLRQHRVTSAQRKAAAARDEAIKSGKVTRAPGNPTGAPKFTGMPMPMPGSNVPDFFNVPNWAYSPNLRKFVDRLPGLGAANHNGLGQYIPVAVADTASYSGCDYYEIGLVQYTEQMHSDLPPTLLRGYVQLNDPAHPATRDANGKVIAWPQPHYLGPLIMARKDRPVRVKFTNLLPTGVGGNLFLPVDTTVMGAGMGPDGMNPPAGDMNYTQNRAVIHLHGGNTPWISDGTPHQWITPAGEITSYPKGVSVRNVPDMPDPGDGSQTFYYSNQQSARLMFYHDHAYGITRLNVYAGEAAGYLLSDPVEDQLVASGVIPAEQIPLIIQDKTFVDATTIGTTDPTWQWGSMPGMPMTGDLWMPHVYMPNQNPWDPEGVNRYGRWDYGPWFWPPWPTDVAPIPLDPNMPDGPQRPGVPDVSMGMENYNDTPLVNGTAYPYMEVQPKAYRFRILNAANDRFWNLQMYVADPTVIAGDGRTNTEVKMVPSMPGTLPAYWPKADARDGGVPDPTTVGPSMIQIGTEGGFLPAPVVWPNIPIGYDRDTRSITIGNIKEHNLLLGPAERADVIIDFSAFSGKTIILYNDAPAPAPAIDPRVDYYTGDPDQTSTGGALPTLPGYGPNTRTIMQIRVAGATPDPTYDINALNAAFASTSTTSGVFARSQDPIIVPQAAYNSAYSGNFPADRSAYVRIQDTSLTFTPLGSTTPLKIDFQPKAIHELFENSYGRMSGFLGIEMPFTNGNNQTTIPYGYMDPATEDITDSMTPLAPAAGDGTQIWKITHNGVDTHPVHFHLFNVQLLNRVDWAGVVKPPDANELGWKETVRMNPLEDCIVALRPVAAKIPFGVPDSIRLLDPTMPVNSTMGFKNIDPQGNPITVTNQLTNFGWEYMWHCHILSHEEMDMMRPIIFHVASSIPNAPSNLAMTTGGALSWTDPTPAATALGNPKNEIGFKIERSIDGAPFTLIGEALANSTTTTIPAPGPFTTCAYRMIAYNAAGNSLPSNTIVLPDVLPGAPTNAIAVAGNTQATVSFTAPANNGGSAVMFYTVIASPGGRTATGTTGPITVTGLTNGTEYSFTVRATNSVGTGPESLPSNKVTPATVPDQPTAVTAVAGNAQATVSFTAPAYNGGSAITGYTVTASPGGITATGTATSIIVTGLTNGTAYTFTVAATNIMGTGLDSLPSNSVIPATVPDKPTAVTAVAGNAQATVSFTAPASNGGRAITGYTVTSSPGGITATGTTTSIVVTGLTNGTGYTFTVKATNIMGTGQDSIPSTSVTPATVPDQPTAVTALAGNTQATVTFTAPAFNGGSAITGYTVTASPGGRTATGTASPITVTGLTNGTTYTFTVKATNVMGTGPASTPSAGVSLTIPTAPSTLTATASALSTNPPTVRLTWRDNSTNETGFTIQRSTSTSFTAGLMTFTVGPNILTYTDTAVAPKTRYFYRVRAINGVGNSAYTSTVSVTTTGQLPVAPTQLTFVSSTRSSITISWTDNAANEQGFTLQRLWFGVWTTIAQLPANTTTYTDTGRSRNTSYSYRARAYNADGTSAYSNIATGSTLP